MSGDVAVLPIFPLNSVLFPYMPLRLRVFEERYLIMLAELLRREEARFGVVLIERGREVGGGEECFSLGTIAEITQLGAQEGFVGLSLKAADASRSLSGWTTRRTRAPRYAK